MEQRFFDKEIIALVRGKKAISRAKLSEYHANDVAVALEQMTPSERRKVYRVLGEDIGDVFSYLDDAGRFLMEMEPKNAAHVLEEMDADDAVVVMTDLPEEKRQMLLSLMDREAAEDIKLIDSYEDDTIGSRMTTNFVAIERHLSIRQAMKSLLAQAADNDNISTIYVLENEKYYGAIELGDLIIARAETDLDTLVTTSYPYVYASEEIEDCVEQLKDYSEDSIPVLDAENRLIGVITAQDIMEMTEEELTDDYAKLAGLTSGEDMSETLFRSISKRLPWLLILLVLGLLVSTVVGVFEKVMQSLTLIVCFQSLILDMAGNTGTQSLAVTIRVLTDEEITALERFKLVLKEIRVAACNGLILGGLSLLFIGLYIHFFKGQAVSFAFAVSGCIGAALLIAMIISGLTGTVIPLFFHKLGVDPAVASGPLITTVNDLVAVVSYYGLAWLFLIRLLGITS